MVVRLRPGMRERYVELHREMPAEVRAGFGAEGIRDFSIFAVDDLLFGYYEYEGPDLAASLQALGRVPRMREWFELMATFQEPFAADPAGAADGDASWTTLEELWHTD